MVDAVAGGRGGAHYSRVLEFGLLLSRPGRSRLSAEPVTLKHGSRSQEGC